ncbi:hypothetical protein ACEN2J_00555 [Pseudorhodobacter sp. W20_MBD10_FR17]|uniref:hypothetical protein n=1 Tax=Pseudorhodobacter sp. W20_MBD10_FR17 TaxID=3240266 RepID=UPI003F9A3381
MKMCFGIITAAAIAASSTVAIAQTITPAIVTSVPAGGVGVGFGTLGATTTLSIIASSVVVMGVVSAGSKSGSGSH